MSVVFKGIRACCRHIVHFVNIPKRRAVAGCDCFHPSTARRDEGLAHWNRETDTDLRPMIENENLDKVHT